jgi:hypothetical protein
VCKSTDIGGLAAWVDDVRKSQADRSAARIRSFPLVPQTRQFRRERFNPICRQRPPEYTGHAGKSGRLCDEKRLPASTCDTLSRPDRIVPAADALAHSLADPAEPLLPENSEEFIIPGRYPR